MTNDSSSMPTAVDDGGGVNFGGTGSEKMKTNLIKTVNNRERHDDAAKKILQIHLHRTCSSMASLMLL